MGFVKPHFPDVDPDEFLRKPLMERGRILTENWVEYGFPSPRMVHAIYILKLVFFYALGGVVVATLTSGLPAFWHVMQWWNQPISRSLLHLRHGFRSRRWHVGSLTSSRSIAQGSRPG
jgi:hypothetical protein